MHNIKTTNINQIIKEMKKSILLGMAVLATGAALTSCSDDWSMDSSSTGRISPMVGIDTEAITSRPAASSRADASSLSAADLSLRLTQLGVDNARTWSWASITDFDASMQFPVGQYSLEAYYGDKNAEGFDAPAFYGRQELTVADDQVTQLALTASLSKSMITLKYTEAFENYMTDWSASVNGITYAKGEQRPIYVKSGDVNINVTVTKPNGKGGSFTLGTIETKPRYHYTVTIDVNEGNVGEATLTVTFDDNLAMVDLDVDISDAILDTPAPTITAEGFDAPINIVSGMGTDAKPSMNIIAMGGLKEVWLETNSVYLAKKGWPESIDLIAATADQQATLTALGLNTLGLWKNPDKMAVIDFSGVLPNIKVMDTDNTTTFTVHVVDGIQRSTANVVLTVNVEDIELELQKIDENFTAGDELNVGVLFNGNASELKNNLSLEYYVSDYNTWDTLDIVSVTPTSSRAGVLYDVKVVAPDVDGTLQLRAKCSGKQSQIDIKSAPFEIAYTSNNVYATHAYLSVVGIDGEADPSLTGATFAVKAEGASTFTPASYTVESGYAHLTGLTPNTTHQVKVTIDGATSRAAYVTTEAAPQLENGNMEAWTTTKVSKGLNSWTKYIPSGQWDTLNDLSLSKADSKAIRSAAESTLSTTDSHAGTAAHIQTVGYGATTTFSSSTNYLAGELFLGSYSGSANYGISFGSRPAAISFWYKYTAFNSGDKGLCEVKVYDASGNVIATGSKSLAAASSYSQQAVALTYAINSVKAARISVRFRSSDSDNYLNSSGVCSISGGNTSKKFIGSELFIDDIVLTY